MPEIGEECFTKVEITTLFSKFKIHVLEDGGDPKRLSHLENFVFPDGQRLEDIPKPPKEYDYWEHVFKKIGYYNYDEKDSDQLLGERIEFLLDYSLRFLRNQLTEKELNKSIPQHFKGPYLPIPQDIEAITEANLEVLDWEPSSRQCKEYYYKSEVAVNKRHKDIFVKNWKDFKKKYKIYDIRPLMGERCVLVWRNERSEVEFTFYRLVDKKTHRFFLLHMLKNLPNLSMHQAYFQMQHLVDHFNKGHLKVVHLEPLGGLELQLMDLVGRKFTGSRCYYRLVSTLIGNRCFKKYYGSTNKYKYRSFPFRNDSLSSDEELMLLNNVLEFYKNKNLKYVIDSTPKIDWMKIFLNMKVRPQQKFKGLWAVMKQMICQVVEEESKKGGRDETNRTEEGNEKKRGGSGKKRMSKKSLSHEQTVQLIDMIYHSDVEDLRDINWPALLLHFPGFCVEGLKEQFNFLYRCRVPKAKQKYFDGAMEYLYHLVKPMYKLKDKKTRKGCKSVEAVFQKYKLQMSTNQKRKLSNFFTRNGGRDADDEHALVVVGEREGGREGERRKKVTFGRGGRRRKKNLFISDDVCRAWLDLMRRSDFHSKFDTEFLDVHENGNEINEMRNENERSEKRNEINENEKRNGRNEKGNVRNENEINENDERNEIENEDENEDEIEVIWTSLNSFQITGSSCPESDDESVGSSGSLEEGRGDYREGEDQVTVIMEGREEENDDDYEEDNDETEFLCIRRLPEIIDLEIDEENSEEKREGEMRDEEIRREEGVEEEEEIRREEGEECMEKEGEERDDGERRREEGVECMEGEEREEEVQFIKKNKSKKTEEERRKEKQFDNCQEMEEKEKEIQSSKKKKKRKERLEEQVQSSKKKKNRKKEVEENIEEIQAPKKKKRRKKEVEEIKEKIQSLRKEKRTEEVNETEESKFTKKKKNKRKEMEEIEEEIEYLKEKKKRKEEILEIEEEIQKLKKKRKMANQMNKENIEEN